MLLLLLCRSKSSKSGSDRHAYLGPESNLMKKLRHAATQRRVWMHSLWFQPIDSMDGLTYFTFFGMAFPSVRAQHHKKVIRQPHEFRGSYLIVPIFPSPVLFIANVWLRARPLSSHHHRRRPEASHSNSVGPLSSSPSFCALLAIIATTITISFTSPPHCHQHPHHLHPCHA